jgi:hypothetical protein
MSVEFPYDWYGTECATFPELAECYAADVVPATGNEYGLGKGGKALREAHRAMVVRAHARAIVEQVDPADHETEQGLLTAMRKVRQPDEAAIALNDLFALVAPVVSAVQLFGQGDTWFPVEGVTATMPGEAMVLVSGCDDVKAGGVSAHKLGKITAVKVAL